MKSQRYENELVKSNSFFLFLSLKYRKGMASIDNVMTLIKILLGNPKTFRGEMYIL